MKHSELFSADPARGWLPWGALAPVLGLLFVIVSALTGTLLIRRFVHLDAEMNPADPPALMAFTLVPFGLLLGVIALWVRFVEKRSLASIGFTGHHKFRTFCRGYLVGLGSLIGIVLVIWLAGGFDAKEIGGAWKSGPALLSIALLVPCFAVQASVEELLFRGWLLSVVAKKFNVVTGVILSSALFAFLHFSPGQHWLVTASNTLFAIYCCAWVLKSRNVLGVMGWHAGWNWLLAVGFNLPLTGLDVGIPALVAEFDAIGPDWLTGGSQGPEGSVVTVVYFLAAMAGIAWIGTRNHDKASPA